MKKKKARGLARTYISFVLFSLIFSFIPAQSFATDSPLEITYGAAFLNDYVGSSLDFSNQSSFQYVINFSGHNQIVTTEEFGIKASTGTLIFSPLEDDSSLEIIVNSSTSTANGVLNDFGSLEFHGPSHIKISVSSALPTTEISTSTVTAITAKKHFRSYSDVTYNLANPTGNYTVFAETYSLMGITGVDFFHATHKLTDGVGDAFYGNDFEETAWTCSDDGDCSRRVMVSMPDYTFSHLKTGSTGEFRFLTSQFDGVATSLDVSPIDTNNLTTPELFALEESRLRASLSIPENYANLPFSIDVDNSKLIRDNDRLVFRIAFVSTDPNYGFLHQELGPFSHLFLNGEKVYPWDANRLRADDGYHESFDIPLSTFTPEPTPPVDPEPDPEPPVEPTPTVTILDLVIPKTPDTGATPETLRRATSTVLISGTFCLVVYTIFVIKLTYGQTIFSLWRHGLRKNHAASPSRLQLRRTRTSSLRHETKNRYQKRKKVAHAHRSRTRN